MLHCGTWNRAVGAEDAAVVEFCMQDFTTAPAPVVPLISICRHSFFLFEATEGAGNQRIVLDIQHVLRVECVFGKVHISIHPRNGLRDSNLFQADYVQGLRSTASPFGKLIGLPVPPTPQAITTQTRPWPATRKKERSALRRCGSSTGAFGGDTHNGVEKSPLAGNISHLHLYTRAP